MPDVFFSKNVGRINKLSRILAGSWCSCSSCGVSGASVPRLRLESVQYGREVVGTVFDTWESHQVLNLGVLGSERVLYRDGLLGSIEEGRSLDMLYLHIAFADNMALSYRVLNPSTTLNPTCKQPEQNSVSGSSRFENVYRPDT